MIEKIIEKTYKYHMPTPNELFEKFKGKFSKASLPDSWYALTPWTTTILDIFYEIGRDLGYTPNREYLRLDQTWEIRHKDISGIILALEHENTSSVSEILDDELQKLLDVKAFVKVLIFYPRFPLAMFETGEFVFPEIQEKIRSAKIKTDEKYVILGLTYLTNQNVIHVSAFSFDSEGKGEDLGDFEINYASKTQQI